MRKWIAALPLAWFAAVAWGQAIVDVNYVKEAVARGAQLWDVREKEGYAAGHIPGAINFGDPTLTLRNSATEDYLPTAEIEKTLGAAGIDPAREIIVYGDRGLPSTYFALVTLRYFGATNAHALHDGIEAWRAAGNPVSTTSAKAKAVTLKLSTTAGIIVDTKDVVTAMKRPDVQIVDVRTVKEFKGEDIRAIRGGHIPNAFNVPFEQNWVDPDTRGKLRTGAVKDTAGMALKPRDQLQKVYEKLDPTKETIVYCQSGNRAAETYVVLQELGFRNVRLYDPSWLGYSSWLSAPADDEVWTNFGSLLTQVKGLENRFGELVKGAPAK